VRLDDLERSGREIVEATLALMDPHWDHDLGMCADPSAGPGSVRGTLWYGLGLLLRGDDDRAWRAISRVLEHQYDEPGTAWHGTFARSAHEPHPPADAQMWVHYDPNWRQFIGTVLALVLECYDAPRLVAERMLRAIRLATEGEPEGRVVPAYSNIALMRAWLDAWAGLRLGERRWVERGEAMAHVVQERFARHGCFDEYNSPTYYGIDLYALALWRGRPPTAAFPVPGAEMEAALWREIARSYHAGMRNLCGPWDRAYGMDMTRYATPLGLYIWDAVGRNNAPFPDVDSRFDHAHDVAFGPLVAAAGTEVPDDARAHLTAFADERVIERTVSDRPRVATAWLSDRAMIGAMDAAGSRGGWDQYHPATIHLLGSSGQLTWIRVLHTGPVDARAAVGVLEVRGAGLALEASEAWDVVGSQVSIDRPPIDVGGRLASLGDGTTVVRVDA